MKKTNQKLDIDDDLDLDIDFSQEEKDKEASLYDGEKLSPETKAGFFSDQSQLKFLTKELLKIRKEIDKLLNFLELPKNNTAVTEKLAEKLNQPQEKENPKIIEGVFTGEAMIGPDGKHYTVPVNYASKSKLVEGDLLKLIIEIDGTFIYKQIGPVERVRIVGKLTKDKESGEYYVSSEERKWRVLKSAVFFFKGKEGDKAIVLVPKDAPAQWAAVENIIHK